jgi:hypothetical protein
MRYVYRSVLPTFSVTDLPRLASCFFFDYGCPEFARHVLMLKER